ncbi:MAG: Nudix family hydrolase [Burkholderiales bacterium]|nr:Nudix family hydrolase [Burkholderiales bacterium]
MPLPAIDVGVGVVRRADGRILLAQRTARQVAPGFWELPGGKVDAGETPAQAAAREVHEEVGLRAEALRPWAVHEHAFRTRRVRLHLFHVERWRGEPHGREGQRVAWVDPAAPAVGPLLPSNERALGLLALPPLAVFTDSARAGGPQAALDRLERLLTARRALVVVREAGLAPGQLAIFAQRVCGVARRYRAPVLIAGAPTLARRAAASGVHTASAELGRRLARPDAALWAVSCHDAGALGRAARLGADLAFVSPVLPTSAHRGLPALGFTGLARLAAAAPMPVYAQGGVRPSHEAQARAAGAIGVAVALNTLAELAGFGDTAAA